MERVILVSGPTCSGKSDFAIALAESINGSIINIDSVQFYKELNIGSAKPSKKLRSKVPHLLYDFLNPDEELDVNRFIDIVYKTVKEVSSLGRIPILVGCSGMYITSLFNGLMYLPPSNDECRDKLEKKNNQDLYGMLLQVDAERASQIHANDRLRIIRALEIFELTGQKMSQLQTKFQPPIVHGLCLVIFPDREKLYNNINLRAKLMVSSGIVEETMNIVNKYDRNLKVLKSIGYADVVKAYKEAKCVNNINISELIHNISQSTRRYAKRQITYWNNEPFKSKFNPKLCIDKNTFFDKRRLNESSFESYLLSSVQDVGIYDNSHNYEFEFKNKKSINPVVYLRV